MGTYIKKVLGYGLQMTVEESSALLDKGITRRLTSMTGVEYIEFLKAKYMEHETEDLSYYLNDLHRDIRSLSEYNASNFITVADNCLDGEKDADTVWVVITPTMVCKEWKHNDDPIDYYEESYKYQDTAWKFDQNIKFMNHGLFPYDGAYVNHATGEQFQSSMVGRIRRYIEVTADESTPAEDKALRLLLATVKVASVEEFKTVIHPAPPISVLDIAEWTGIFKDDSIAPRLRPCLLQYWS